MLLTKQIIVTGKVQGVFFRQSAKTTARSLGITGYVKNMPDGSVFIIATGTEIQLSKLIEWCHQGPVRAEVSFVEAANLPIQKFLKFSIL
ncbi:MAG TPA: acylphosphatase [Niabella sp.]|jgi:acylphosphatase|nr:acylphosphatase [Chitinophagaceae bacterium]HUN03279.1 acylphosphatase [Niabella sp.]